MLKFRTELSMDYGMNPRVELNGFVVVTFRVSVVVSKAVVSD